MGTKLKKEKRGTWNTRTAFILAAIGSAVGLGNLWGFPYKLYAYGGGAFLIPYFIAMLVIGIPLLIMEFSIGHWARQSPPGAFAAISQRYKFVGWWLTILAFIIITYYTVILGYCVLFLIQSIHGIFSGSLPWAGSTEIARNHFFQNTLAYADGFKLSGIRWPILGAMLLSWIMIYLCLFKGVKWVSKVVLITVPLPWIMLIILTIRGLTLDGAITGLHFYLEPHWGKLAEVDTWRFAFGQVFFSMSLGFAVMISYASFLPKRSDINNNALIIGLGDLATSFIAGIAVFATLGAMAMVDNAAVEQVVAKGPGLAFVTFPYALSTLPAGQGMFSLIFFVALLTLGIDSAFSIVEACLAGVCDNKPKWPRAIVLPAICIIGFVIGIIFCFGGGGLNILGFVDDLINGPLGILLVALVECLVVGWAHNGNFVTKMRKHANENSDWQLSVIWDIIIKYIAPIFLVVLITWSISEAVYKHDMINLIGSAVFIAIPIMTWLLRADKKQKLEPTEKTVTTLVILVPLASIITGSLLGLWRIFRPATEIIKKTMTATQFEPKTLGVTGYITLTIALSIIIIGLVWCFIKAKQKAEYGKPEK